MTGRERGKRVGDGKGKSLMHPKKKNQHRVEKKAVDRNHWDLKQKKLRILPLISLGCSFFPRMGGDSMYLGTE